MEYGLGVDILPNTALKILKDTQNVAFRKLLSVGNQTSISAMHKILNLAPIKTRNQVLNAKYLTRLNKMSSVEFQDMTIITQMLSRTNRKNENDFFKSILNNPFWDKAESMTMNTDLKSSMKHRRKMPPSKDPGRAP